MAAYEKWEEQHNAIWQLDKLGPYSGIDLHPHDGHLRLGIAASRVVPITLNWRSEIPLSIYVLFIHGQIVHNNYRSSGYHTIAKTCVQNDWLWSRSTHETT